MQKNICISIDATGRRDELEKLAIELGLKIEDSSTQYLTAIDYISLVGSIITIIDFLVRIKELYGKQLLIDNKIPIDNAIHYILRQHNMCNEQMTNLEKLIMDMIQAANKSLPIPIQMYSEGVNILPAYNKSENILYCSSSCATTILLFSLYQSRSVNVRKILLLYVLTELNINRHYLVNANKLLDKLEREIKLLDKIEFFKVEKIYLSVQLLFLVGHELQHAHYRFDENSKINDMNRTEQRIVELYSSPMTYRQKQIFKFLPEICNEKQRLEELSCDSRSVYNVADYISTNFDVNEKPVLYTQLLRLVTMLQYVINIHELAEFTMKSIRLHVKKHIFDVIRVGNILISLDDITNFNVDEARDLSTKFQKEVYKYNNVLTNTIKIGLADLWILYTAHINLEKGSPYDYDTTCNRFHEISQNIQEKLLNLNMLIL